MDNITIIVLCVIALCILYFLLTYNRFIKLKNKVEEAFATMDVYLKKRWDLIPNIVETVKGYAKHEKDTLKEIVNLRNENYDNMSDNEKIEKNKEITKGIAKIMVLAEAYPELKANENFLSLSKELSSIEDEIAQSRKYYNAVVRDYNDKVQMIPSNFVALMMKLKPKTMFIAEEEERKNVKVKL